jgi:hypothetical protein
MANSLMLEPKLSLTNATPGLEVVLGDLEAAKMENNEGNMVRRKSGPFLLHGRLPAEIQKKSKRTSWNGMSGAAIMEEICTRRPSISGCTILHNFINFASYCTVTQNEEFLTSAVT